MNTQEYRLIYVPTYTQEEMQAILAGFRKRWPDLSIDISVFNGDYRKEIVCNVLNITAAMAEALITVGQGA